MSSGWIIFDTAEAPSSSFEPQPKTQTEPPVDDIQKQEEMNLSDTDDTDHVHLPKIPTSADWFRPIQEEERPKTPEPDWVVPKNALPEPENNWANELANAPVDPDENKLARRTDDMGVFIKWYCRRIGKTKLTKADLEGPAYKAV